MIRASILIALAFSGGGFLCGGQTEANRRQGAAALRIAVIGFSNGGQVTPDKSLLEALARARGVVLIERSLVQPALAGVGYDGSINMSTEEARRLGAAIGCDFFVTGKAEALTRSEREGESHEEAILAVMIVDGRSGALAVFDLIIEKAASREAAASLAVKRLDERVSSYLDRLAEFRAAREAPISPPASFSSPSGPERVEDMPEEGSDRAGGFKPPEFLNRVKPVYTDEAARADISATVDAMAVFRADASVGSIEITRWAGFGLDEAVVEAIRQLKFQPATRDGKPVSVRAALRYNFRRVNESK